MDEPGDRKIQVAFSYLGEYQYLYVKRIEADGAWRARDDKSFEVVPAEQGEGRLYEYFVYIYDRRSGEFEDLINGEYIFLEDWEGFPVYDEYEQLLERLEDLLEERFEGDENEYEDY